MTEGTFLSFSEVEVVLRMLDKDRAEEYSHSTLADTRDYVKMFNNFEHQDVKNLRLQINTELPDMSDYQATLLINLAP